MKFLVKKKIAILMGFVLVFLTIFSYDFTKRKQREIATEMAKSILSHRISKNDQRFITFKYALKLMHRRHVKTIVETGTSRNGECNCSGDGCSTPIWGEWAKNNKAHVYSVDIDSQAILNSSLACKPYKEYVRFITSDSVEFLNKFDKSIDFLYLDSYDFDSSNPEPSQEHHLKEIVAAYPHLHEKSIVMIDDCRLSFGGKGKLVIQYLLDRGWKMVLSEYQVILVRNSSLK